MAGYMMTSQTNEWETPQWLFDRLNKEFHFTLDVAASPVNAKCKKYFTKEQNGLIQSWEGEVCWCNPPYGHEIKDWVAKAATERCVHNVTTVMLLPARTDTHWFHDYIYQREPFISIRFLKGRLKFGGAKSSAPFPSMIVIFRPILNQLEGE